MNDMQRRLAEADATISNAKLAVIERLAAMGITATVSLTTYSEDRPTFSVYAKNCEPFQGYGGLCGYATGYGCSIAQAFADVMRKIDAVEDVRPYADDFAAPLFLMSEQHAQAAE